MNTSGMLSDANFNYDVRNIINKTLLISFGYITEVLDNNYVQVSLCASNTGKGDSIVCPIISTRSKNLSIYVEPNVNDLVEIRSIRDFEYGVFNTPETKLIKNSKSYTALSCFAVLSAHYPLYEADKDEDNENQIDIRVKEDSVVARVNTKNKITFTRDTEDEENNTTVIETLGHTITITKDDISFDSNDKPINVDGKELNVTADTTLDGNTTIKGASKTLTIAGTVTPTGTGCLCGMAFCPMTGAPIAGSKGTLQ